MVNVKDLLIHEGEWIVVCFFVFDEFEGVEVNTEGWVFGDGLSFGLGDVGGIFLVKAAADEVVCV